MLWPYQIISVKGPKISLKYGLILSTKKISYKRKKCIRSEELGNTVKTQYSRLLLVKPIDT